MESKSHWESVCSSQSAEAVSWYQPHAPQSLKLIQRIAARRPSRVIDIGSAAALDVARHRLADRARRDQWIDCPGRRRLRTAGAPERGPSHADGRGAAVCPQPRRDAWRRAAHGPALELP